MKSKLTIFLLCASGVFLSFCKNKKVVDPIQVSPTQAHYEGLLSYDLNNPTKVFSLERDLYEISGLTYSTTFNKLLAINDEKGYVYFLDLSTARIQGRIDFGKSEDYEGIAYHDGLIYITESNGDISVVDEESEDRVSKYNTRLSRKNDVEGITYNLETSTFLIAAKGYGNLDKINSSYKSIFSLDPYAQKISKEPYFTFDMAQSYRALIKSDAQNQTFNSSNKISRIKKFSPSGIAVHPNTNEIYVLSSRGKIMAIFDQKGNLKALEFLDESVHPQPEGICFGPDQTLYISNEGRAGKGRVLVFKYQS